MKIALIGPFPPPLGGVSTNVRRLSELLRRDGYDVRTFVEAPAQENRAENAHWHSSRPTRPGNWLPRAVRAFKPDLLHSHSSTLRKYDAFLAGWLGTPLVYQIYGERFPEQYRQWSFPARRLAGWALGRARRVIPASSDLAAFVETLGANPKNVVTIPCLLPLEDPDGESGGFPEELVGSRGGKRIVLVTSGFYEAHYGLNLVPQVAATLRKHGLDFVWIIVGPASREEHGKLQAKIARAGMEKLVIQAGELSRKRMLALLQAADFYVRTKSSDSFGIVVAEAHQLGCRCLFADSNPYFRPDGKRLFSYRTGAGEDLTQTLLAALAGYDPRRPRERESPFRAAAAENYRRIRQVYREAGR